MKPVHGTSYVLTTNDQSVNPPALNATSVIPVHILGCTNCGTLSLHVPRKKRVNPKRG